MTVRQSKAKKTSQAKASTTEASTLASVSWALAMAEGIPVAAVYLALRHQLADLLAERDTGEAEETVFTVIAVAVETAAILKSSHFTEERVVSMVRGVFLHYKLRGILQDDEVIENHLVRKADGFMERLRQHPEAGVVLPDAATTQTILQYDDLIMYLARQWFADELNDSASTDPDARPLPAKKARAQKKRN